MNTKRIVKIAVVAAIYAVLTIVLAPISYGHIQFRISEFMVLLPFINPSYIWGLTLGCFIANLYSPLGIIDLVFGTLATFLSCYFVSRSKKLEYAVLYPAVFNGVIVGLELYYIIKVPALLTILYVFLGELAVVALLGYTITRAIMKNKKVLGFFKDL